MLIHPFLLKTQHFNPPTSYTTFEEYFCRRFLAEGKEYGRALLSVTWTAYYISQGYKSATPLEQYLLYLAKTNRKWFTICQWDSGILWQPDDLDLFVFGQGGVGDYPIPLNCEIPEYSEKPDRDILCSFVGKIWDRHPAREEMYRVLSKHHEIPMIEDPYHRYELFKNTIQRSIFSLCPRGFGLTSFRLAESLFYGSIPIYIWSDVDWSPFPDLIKDDYMIKCHVSELPELYEKLKNISKEEIDRLRANGAKVYRDYFSYDGCYNKIIEKLGSI